MKIVILGAGALGSVIGGHLARAGDNVILITRGHRAAHLEQHGITLAGLADFSTPVTVITDPHAVREADVLVVSVKTYDTEAALASVRHLDVGSVLSVQNGVLKNEQLAQTFGREKTLGAAAMVSGEVTAEGAVCLTLNERLAVGELPEGTSERVQSLVGALARAGICGEASPHIRTVEWSKYVLFVSWMATAVLTRLETYRFLRDRDLATITARLMQETGRLAAELGVPLEDEGPVPVKTLCRMSRDEAVAQLRQVGTVMEARAPAHKMSTLQDLERGRRLEVEETLGYAARKGAELDVPLPTIEACYRLIAGINRFGQ